MQVLLQDGNDARPLLRDGLRLEAGGDDKGGGKEEEVVGEV